MTTHTPRRELQVSIRHLRLFESVAQLQGVRRASEECHLSQPAVTQAIARLEEQLGVQLLERSSTGSYLNAYGLIFHARTQRFFAQLEQALLELGIPASPHPPARISSRLTRSQIRSLIAIVENGTFARAARHLELSQTSLQRAARDLERTLRTPLYIQTATGIVAAPNAVEFARKIKLAEREIAWGIEELEAALGSSSCELVIGALLLSGSVILASVINEILTSFPGANIRILNGNADDVLRYLRNGDVDIVIGLLQETDSPEFAHEALAETPYAVVARHDHPLMKLQQVSYEDLARYEWVIGTPGSHRRLRFEKMFAGQEKQPVSRVATCALPLVRTMLSQGERITLLTEYELMYEDDTLGALRVDPPGPAPSIGLATRQNWLPTQMQRDVIALIKQRIAGSFSPLRALRTTAQLETAAQRERSARIPAPAASGK